MINHAIMASVHKREILSKYVINYWVLPGGYDVTNAFTSNLFFNEHEGAEKTLRYLSGRTIGYDALPVLMTIEQFDKNTTRKKEFEECKQ